jgi:hypothetical protein
MQRLRPLSESECYVRCYGKRIESVTLLGVQPRSLSPRELIDPQLFEAHMRERSSEPVPAGPQLVAVLAQPE